MSDKIINVSKDFSVYPYARYESQSDTSGEKFRQQFLLPALRENTSVTIILDGTEGYGSSWFDESFAGLVRNGEFTADELLAKINFISTEDPTYIDEIKGYVSESSKAK